MKILLLTRYGRLGASSRIRSYQYIPYLKNFDIEVTKEPLFDNQYIKRLYFDGHRFSLNIMKNYLHRLKVLMKSNQYDLIWIEKELFPWLPNWGELILSDIGIPYVVDYDDAIYHRYDAHNNFLIRCLLKNKIFNIMRHGACVIVGNEYLAEYAKRAGAKRIEIIPSVVDLNLYSLSSISKKTNNDYFTIGWIGSPITSRYLKIIEPALTKICKDGTTKLVIIGANRIKINVMPVEIRQWIEDKEVEEIQNFDVGIMPLPDDLWEKGKCGYKLVQYMACAKPVVASPVGINRTLVSHGIDGFLASNTNDWVYALKNLRDNKKLRKRLGQAGRRKVENKYCLQVTVSKLIEILFSSRKITAKE